MARVSHLRPTSSPGRAALSAPRRPIVHSGSLRRGRLAAGGALALVLLVAGVAVLLARSAPGSLSSDPSALARVTLPLGGGTIDSVSAVTGPHSRPIPVALRGEQVWPRRLIGAHELVSIDVVVRRAGWISWLTGRTERLHLTLMTPSASLGQRYLTLRPGAPLLLSFREPVAVVAYGQPGRLVRRVLSQPVTQLRVPRSAPAGEISVAAVPRRWETSSPAVLSWFPAGAAAVAVASPSPGTAILPGTPITLTFSKTVEQALGANRPPVSPANSGAWHAVSSHTITFRPEGYGYGLGSRVSVALPGGVRLVGAQGGAGQGGAAQGGAGASGGTWTVPGGSPLRLAQLLAGLGYLPLRFDPAAEIPLTPRAQEAAAIDPPAGSFSWRYANVPGSLRGAWSRGSSGVITKGALMAFEHDHGLSTDGIAGAIAWRALIGAVDAGKGSSFGYTYVSVSLSGQRLSLWHSGRTVLTAAVNTGISAAATAPGTFPVYEHIASGTMSGTNPDGSHYHDPGIQYISYFNGGDALHAFTRAQYGFPQSLGCVEMALGPAGRVYPYTPIGTIVHVE